MTSPGGATADPSDAELHVALREVVAIGRRGGYDNDEIAEKLARVVRDYAADTNSPFEPCADAPIGVVTNCAAMKCERNGCAVAAAKAAPPVSLDDLTIPTRRDCQCPNLNPDCEHPTCPRWPQPGHFATEAAELVDAWETGGKGYGDLEQRIAAALVDAILRALNVKGADAFGCPETAHLGVDCPGDRCRHALDQSR